MAKEKQDKTYLNLGIWTLSKYRYRVKVNGNKFSELMIMAVNVQSDMRILSEPHKCHVRKFR